jgi:hypothetical protein
MTILSKSLKLAVIASLINSVLAVTTHAANISVKCCTGDDRVAMVTVDGRILPADGELFRSKTGALSKATIILRSPGGSVVAGIQIGEFIRQKGFSSLAVGRSCASACALAWLGGTPRFMAPEAQVGFHAAYDLSGQEKGEANALIGAYLNKFGLSYKTVMYLTHAAPASMLWLTSLEAEQLGIDVTLFSGVVPQAAPQPVILPASPTREAQQPGSPHGPLPILPQIRQDVCRVVAWFRSACGALAVGAREGFGADWGATRYEAENIALKTCNSYTTDCRIRRWVCTPQFGAIAFSTSNGAFGYSNDYSSRDGAEQRALAECSAR